MNDLEKIFANAKAWILEAGEMIKDSLHDERKISTKADDKDLVTEMDQTIEAYFIEKIKKTYPTHLILAEEGHGHHITNTTGTLWMIDPIDGTTNFIHQKRNFAISIGIFVDGIGKIGLIYDVISDEMFHVIQGQGAFLNDTKLPKLTEVPISEAVVAVNTGFLRDNQLIGKEVMQQFTADVRGTRALGAASLQIAYVACGRFDAYMSMQLGPWDFAAGLVLIAEVGGEITRFCGEDLKLLEKSSLFVSKPGFHQAFYKSYQLN